MRNLLSRAGSVPKKAPASNRPVEDWENCWVTAPLSPPCWIACCITVTSSSAARAVGAPKPAVREMHNDKSKSKDKCNKECRAKNARRRRDSHPQASHDGASPKESLQKQETLRRKPRQGNRRGSRLPIPSEPAPCHRPRITPQGATPAEHYNTNT